MGKVQILQHRAKNTNEQRFLDDNSFYSLSLSQVSTSDLEAKAHKHPISSFFQVSSSKEESIETEASGLRAIPFCCSHKNFT